MGFLPVKTPAAVLAEYLGVYRETGHRGSRPQFDLSVTENSFTLDGFFDIYLDTRQQDPGEILRWCSCIRFSVEKTGEEEIAERSSNLICGKKPGSPPEVGQIVEYDKAYCSFPAQERVHPDYEDRPYIALFASLKFYGFSSQIPAWVLDYLVYDESNLSDQIDQLARALQRADEATFEKGELVVWTDDHAVLRTGLVTIGDNSFRGLEQINVDGTDGADLVPREKLQELDPKKHRALYTLLQQKQILSRSLALFKAIRARESRHEEPK